MISPKEILLDQVLGRMWLKNKANQTEDSYLYWIDQYILFHNKSQLNEMGVQSSSNPSPFSAKKIVATSAPLRLEKVGSYYLLHVYR
jgi:hypothetical protein